MLSLILPWFTFTHAAKEGHGVKLDTSTPIQIPKDLYPHPGFTQEWWYFSGVVDTEEKIPYAYNYTIFKGLSSYSIVFQLVNLYTGKIESFVDKIESLEQTKFGYSMVTVGNATMQYNRETKQWGISIDEEMFKFYLDLQLVRPYALNGGNGYIDQSSAAKSAYFSAQNMDAKGSMTIDGKTYQLTGKDSWLDRQWGNFAGKPAAFRYTWFSCRFDDNTGLMLYWFYDENGEAIDKYLTGTFQAANGKSSLIRKFKATPITDGTTFTPKNSKYPMYLTWTLDVPAQDIKLRIVPLVLNQYVNSRTEGGFWEGAMAVSGNRKGYCFLEASFGSSVKNLQRPQE